MHPTLVVLHLAAAVMLLLWAVRMVRTGVERAHGRALKNALRKARAGHLRGALAGTVLAVVLQSSTAVGILAAGFAASGILAVSTGIAILLGADLGSALVVQILSFDLSWAIPVLMLAGATLFLKFERREVRQGGRILLGIAFILLSLDLIGAATTPLRESALLPQVVGYLRNDPITAFALAALLTWLIHSSVAAILLFAAFAAEGVLPVEVGLPMVLGANVGGGMIAVWLTRGQSAEARRIPLGNLLFRSAAALALLPAVAAEMVPVALLGADPARQMVNLHLAFNALLVLACLPLTGAMARLTALMLPDAGRAEQAARLLARPASALDEAALDMPRLALASATRELLRMGETVETMFRPVMELLEEGNAQEVARVAQLDEEVNQAHTDIKLFIARVNRGRLSAEEAQRGMELTSFAINLEHIGDIVAKTLLPLAEKKAKRRLQFSEEGWSEMTRLHQRVLANMQLALNVLVSGDLASARQLVKEKELMRRLERESHHRHLMRLQSGMMESIETSDIHLEVVRALKEINSLLATAAYPILSESGDLLESRLAQPAA
ncbi:Na/Pi cotransporter family protein [Aquibium sp. A9E412]|uniref:Na/Pi cotransporter family protein n=1 Tax=Aquibium sp. A9E412 TaxID=2976767 RepID=UPI0025AFF7B8|nr:Na/Pi cotransporter family protein [Aquibium sp. A9E412]MDN2568104.1 Na/Pi cotransporter family protein [Aquibium sp. A9E412]